MTQNTIFFRIHFSTNHRFHCDWGVLVREQYYK